jgi:glycosyltransferase involved in cell wall biosynthesis
VGFYAIFLEPPMGGLESYVREVVPAILRLAPTVRLTVFCSAGGHAGLSREDWSGEVELVAHPLLGRRGLKALSETAILGWVAGRRVELLHSVAFTAPLWTTSVNVVMVPDTIWLTAPDEDQAATMRLWRMIVPAIAARADRLIAISQAGADDIVRRLRVERGKIDVVPLGPGIGVQLAPTPEGALRKTFALGGGPVVLAVSAKKIHKNLTRMIEAMSAVCEREPDATLVLVGQPTAHERELRALADRMGLARNVKFPGFVDAADLEGLYACASCFVLPSLVEGFGLPILEAMRRGVPVACSNVSAMPEVAGEAARYFDPLQPSEIASAVIELLHDRTLAASMIAAGHERARAFSWTATAERTLECYERAWHGRGSARR